MLSMIDCIAFSGLTPEQLDAVACHQHLPPVVAAEWAETMLEKCDGCARIEAVLAEEVASTGQHHRDNAEAWRRGLCDFRRTHPH